MPLKYDECLRELGDALKIDPKNSKALFRKAKVLKSLGRSEESLEVIQTFFDSIDKNREPSSKEQGDVKLFTQLKAEVKK